MANKPSFGSWGAYPAENKLGRPIGVMGGLLGDSNFLRAFSDFLPMAKYALDRNNPGTPPGGGGGGDGGVSPPPPPGPTPVPDWSFPQYTQNWAFTPPAPFYTAPPPVFNKKNYPTTATTTKK
jgi:hypothetical protein